MRNKTAKKLRKLSEAMDMPINDVKRMYHDKTLPNVLAKYDSLVVDKVNNEYEYWKDKLGDTDGLGVKQIDRMPVDDEQN